MAEPPHTAPDLSGHPLAGGTVLVVGVGIAGASAARVLLRAGADVLLTARTESESVAPLVAAGARWWGPLTEAPPDAGLVVVSPGIRPNDPLLLDAADRGIPVWGEAEFAWQLRGPDAAPWLALTGTNGKTTTVHMLESILRAAGLRAAAVGNVGVPMIDAVVADPGYDVLAVELSSQQLHFAPSLAPAAGAVLNIAADHLDWHGSMDAYASAKTRVWAGEIAIGNDDDPLVSAMFADCLAPARVGFTLGQPEAGQLGIAGGSLVSRAFGDDGADLVSVADVHPAGEHNLANALAAAALARAYGVAPAAIAAGLRDFVPDPHRNEVLFEHGGVVFVDDSKATNAHAARGSLLAHGQVVWVAGGQLKGASVDDLVADVAHRLAGVVLLGADRAAIAEAVRRHAPEIPVIEVDTTDDGAMVQVVRAALGLASPGDTVLLAPAGASYDMFSGFAARGDAFAAAAREVTGT